MPCLIDSSIILWHFVGPSHAFTNLPISPSLVPHLLLWLLCNTAVYLICIVEQTQEQRSILDVLFRVGLISTMLSIKYTRKAGITFIFTASYEAT